MTRPELVAAIRDLPDKETLDLQGQLSDSLDHDTPPPDWHFEELDRRLESADAPSLSHWSEAKTGILGSK